MPAKLELSTKPTLMVASEVKPVVMDSDAGGSSRKCEGEASTSVGIVETYPDMLKNTPSNIRRLVVEIEQCEGRQKYLVQTRSPSDGGDVRWYFCKVPLAENELAASVPRMEVVGKSDYFRFGMRDSLAIEASFLQREEELLSSWWKEYAECSEGPKGHPLSGTKLDPQPMASSVERVCTTELNAIEEERVGVPVKGGLYEVDLVKRHCFPVYWDGENRRVLRGHWFARKGGLNWLPLREDVAEQLEYAYRTQVWHRRTFQPSGLFAARVDLQGSTLGLHALFTGEDDTWEAWLNVDASGFSSIINLGKNGIKLRRGYAPSESPKPTQDELRQKQEEEMDDYCSQVPVRHLVFMVHGIGQRLEKSNLVDDVGNFRHITASLAERHLTSYQRDTQRVLYIPCQWRRGLKLSGETAVEKITLDGVRGLRVMLSATVHDVLYYMSPIYCQDIINSVSYQLNLLYLKFLKRNPGYDGKVSIYGHSLGSVLSYDILCHQENLSSPFPMNWMYMEHTENENSSPNIDNQSSERDCVSNPNDNFVVDNGTEPTLLVHEDEHAEDFSVPSGHPVTSDSEIDEPSVIAIDPKQSNGILLDEDVLESVSESSDMISHKRNGLNESPSMKSRVTVAESKKISEEVSECDEDRAIKLLQKENDFLKARITELESQRGKGNKEEITTMTTQAVSEELPPRQNDTTKSYTPYIKYTKLEFKVDTFFAVGSPLGVFLSLRNIRIGIGKGQEYWEEENISEEMPACRQMFNIFHPFDPVAYRIEPLVCKEYIGKRPVIIPYHRGGKRLHIGFQEFAEDCASRSQAVMAHLSSVKVLTFCQSRNKDGLDEESENAQGKYERSYGSIMMERLTGNEDGRIDHVLQDKTFQHPYISALGSHTNYWRDFDTALFILKHLYRDIPEEPIPTDAPKESSSREETGSEGRSDQREVADEELPLTFADGFLIRNFSRKANKIMKQR
ncbi:phospholipase SGR2 isoform X2 [Cornus florida]|uniref:phospholipase SGR2 isoform X2 n=1 Tax=Cornus florida TaxID=4283 RepID=UPI0028A27833|nr:phospholipase SGR2 isoform X2 [Cornus florida]